MLAALLLVLNLTTGACGLVLGRVAPTISLDAHAALARSSQRSYQMQSDVPISPSSSLAEIRAIIAERGLDIKTTGKGRTKKIIFEELVALCASADGCEVGSDAETTTAGAAAAKDSITAQQNHAEDEVKARAAAEAAEAARVAAEEAALWAAEDAARKAAEEAEKVERAAVAAAAAKAKAWPTIQAMSDREWWNKPY